MTHELKLVLTEEEYTALTIEAANHGQQPEALIHEIMTEHMQSSKPRTRIPNSKEIQNYLYREGIIEYVPTGELETQTEAIEREHLAQLFGQGKPVSEMVIEDRGPH